MRVSHGFLGLVAALVLASGCNYVTGLEDNTYDRTRGAGGATGPGGAGGATSSSTGGGGDQGGAYPTMCTTLTDFGTPDLRCSATSTCAWEDLFDPRDTDRTRSGWMGEHFTATPGNHVQVCPEGDGELVLTPPTDDGPMGSEWYQASQAGSLYVQVDDGPVLVATRVSVQGADDAFQGGGISIYADAQRWLLLSLGVRGQTEVGVQAYRHSTNTSGAFGQLLGMAEPTEGIVAACRTTSASAPWYLYYWAAEDLHDVNEIQEVATTMDLTNDVAVQVGITAHNYQDQPNFEARFRWAFVTNEALDSEGDCRAQLEAHVAQVELEDAEVQP